MADENENGVKISALTTAHRADLEGAFVPVALPNQQTYKVPLEEFTDPLEIMVAVFGTTDLDAVTAALAAGKTIFAARQVSSVTRLAPLTDHSIGAYHFVWQNSDGTREIWELTSNGWTADDLPGGASELFTDDTLTGSGTSDDPLGVNTEEIEEIALGEAEDVVDAVRSKILYTLDLGSVSGGQSISGSQFHIEATLFNPNMNQELSEATSTLLFATNQTEGEQQSAIENKKAFLAIYRYDMSTESPSGVANSINWVANTDNIISMLGGPNYQKGLKHVKFAHIADGSEEGQKETLYSNKMYYLVMISNCTGCKIVGNAKSEQLNTTPYTAFRIDNAKIAGTSTAITINDIDKDTLRTILPTLTPESEINSRLFAAITNVQIPD